MVTEQLAVAFGEALDVVRAALKSSSSKAAYLDSSFGGGKSHFMAMVRLLLEGNPAARAVPELAGVVADNAEWLEGKRFLTPTFHLIGSTSIEEAVLGGYVRYVKAVRPDAALPDVFVDAPLMANAETLRVNMGDEAFFAALNRTVRDDAALGFCLLARHDAVWEPGTARERSALADEMTAAAHRCNDLDMELQAALRKMVALLERGDPKGLDELVALGALAERTGLPRQVHRAGGDSWRA